MLLSEEIYRPATVALCVLIFVSLVSAYVPQAVAVATFSVPISIKGLPSTLSTTIIIDGKQSGTIPGGGSKSFQVDKKSGHTFEVDAEIKGSCSSYQGTSVCTRYRTPNNVWTVEIIKQQECHMVPVCYQVYVCDCCCCWWETYCGYEQQCWTTTELSEKGHTFEYYGEHEVAISDRHGQNVDNWYKDGADLNISTEQYAVTKDEADIKERDIFRNWIVNGVPMESKTLALKVDKPYYLTAEYETETQYGIKVSSEFGNPTMDKPKGWYMKGEEATISIQKEIPTEGWWGALGGKRVFVGWRSDTGVQSSLPTFAFVVEEPTTLRAEWRADDWMPITILSALGIIIIAALAVFVLYSRGVFKSKAAKAEPTELEKAKAEIERLKQEQEERPAKRRPVRKKKPLPPAAETTST